MKLYPHQEDVLKQSVSHNRVAYYYDLGLGKTYIGAEKLIQLGNKVNLVICQKSKIDDWVQHFKSNYSDKYLIFDLTYETDLEGFMSYQEQAEPYERIGVINYELCWRRPELLQLRDFTLMLDESSLIQNETTKRSKFILKLKAQNVILLSGTPTDGKYERLYSQLKLLGWKISKELYYRQYIDYHYDNNQGFPRLVIDGYKNVNRLKDKLHEYGAYFKKADDVLDLPEQIFIPVKIKASKEYELFKKHSIVTVNNKELVGDTTLTQMLYERMLCGAYSDDKLEAFRELVESTSDRLIVFYNFNAELDKLIDIAKDYTDHISVVNGETKDLTDYCTYSDSITFIQYQAGAMGLNLQKANKIVYYSPPLSSSLYEQSKGRIRRIGQERTCFYYNFTVLGSIENKIYKSLDMRRDYTDELFKRGE